MLLYLINCDLQRCQPTMIPKECNYGRNEERHVPCRKKLPSIRFSVYVCRMRGKLYFHYSYFLLYTDHCLNHCLMIRLTDVLDYDVSALLIELSPEAANRHNHPCDDHHGGYNAEHLHECDHESSTRFFRSHTPGSSFLAAFFHLLGRKV